MKFRIPKLTFKKTTSGIVAPLAKIVRQLETHAAYQSREAAAKVEASAVLLEQSHAHESEATKASNAAAKISGLFA